MTYNIHIPRSVVRSFKRGEYCNDIFSDAVAAATGIDTYVGATGIHWPDGSYSAHSRTAIRTIRNADNFVLPDRPIRFRITVYN